MHRYYSDCHHHTPLLYRDFHHLRQELAVSLPSLAAGGSSLLVFVAATRTPSPATTIQDGKRRKQTHQSGEEQKVQRFGRNFRKLVANFYNAQTTVGLALDIARTKQMFGWSHHDLLRLAHPTPTVDDLDIVFDFIAAGYHVDSHWNFSDRGKPLLNLLHKIERIRRPGLDDAEVANILKSDPHLDIHHIDRGYLRHPSIWRVLVPKMEWFEVLEHFWGLHWRGVLQDGTIAHDAKRAITACYSIEAGHVHPLEFLLYIHAFQRKHRKDILFSKMRQQRRDTTAFRGWMGFLTKTYYDSLQFTMPMLKSVAIVLYTEKSMHLIHPQTCKDRILSCFEIAQCFIGGIVCSFDYSDTTKSLEVFSMTSPVKEINSCFCADYDVAKAAMKSLRYQEPAKADSTMEYLIRYGKMFDAIILIQPDCADESVHSLVQRYRTEINCNTKFIDIGLCGPYHLINAEGNLDLCIHGFTPRTPEIICKFINGDFDIFVSAENWQ